MEINAEKFADSNKTTWIHSRVERIYIYQNSIPIQSQFLKSNLRNKNYKIQIQLIYTRTLR